MCTVTNNTVMAELGAVSIISYNTDISEEAVGAVGGVRSMHDEDCKGCGSHFD